MSVLFENKLSIIIESSKIIITFVIEIQKRTK